MRIYTVHIKETDRQPPDDIKAVAVREAFSIWAFLFRFLWAAANGAWIVAAIILGVEIALVAGMSVAGLDDTSAVLLGLVWAFAIGLFARDLKRWELSILGYELRGAVVARDRDDALRRYFDEEGISETSESDSDKTVPQFREDIVAPPLGDTPRMTVRPSDAVTDVPPGPRLGPRLTQ